MARKNSTPVKTQPAVVSLFYEMPTSVAGVSRFIDLSSDLSRLNRKLMRQGYQYAVAGVTVTDDVGVVSALDVSISTAGNTWITQNAWTKGRALWDEMNQEVLDDNPSVQVKWADYKVSLTENMAAANTIAALNGAAGAFPGGYEWAKSTYVVPQHDVDPATGLVQPALEFTACLVGPDDLPNGVFSLVKAYEDSRATVQDITPNVPTALPTSFYLQLTDDGSQDPELATVIIDQNDQPPYSMNAGAYPGGAAFTTSEATTRVARGVKNDFTPTLHLPGFTAECGLLRIDAVRSVGTDNCRIQIHLAPGSYRGVMAVPMGQ
jgi:hypothetical protein